MYFLHNGLAYFFDPMMYTMGYRSGVNPSLKPENLMPPSLERAKVMFLFCSNSCNPANNSHWYFAKMKHKKQALSDLTYGFWNCFCQMPSFEAIWISTWVILFIKCLVQVFTYLRGLVGLSQKLQNFSKNTFV